MSKKGIDISKWQEKVDFDKVKKAGIQFAIFREGYGTSVDGYFNEYVAGAKKAGIPIHAVYHFCYSVSEAEVLKEAKACIANIQKAGLPKSTIVFFDFEYDTVKKAKAKGVTLGKTQCTNFTVKFCDYVQSQGYKAGVYCNLDYYRNMYDASKIRKYILWIAQYNGGTKPSYDCTYHQYTSSGKVSGINGNVDMNLYYGTDETKKEDEKVTYDIQKAIDVATNEIGYLEKASNSQLDSKTANAGSNNYTKYWRDMANLGLGNYQGQYWCACFIAWVFYMAYGLKAMQALLLHSFYISCSTLANLAAKAGRLFSSPQVGDVMIFYSSSKGYYHTEYVVGVTASTITTIGGNTSGGSSVISNGGGVAKKTYNRSSVNAKFFRPDYGMSISQTGSSTNTNTTTGGNGYMFNVGNVQNGITGNDVKLLQRLLKSNGFKGKDGNALTIDGDCGSNTVYAIKNYQTKKSLSVDGCCGPATWKSILLR